MGGFVHHSYGERVGAELGVRNHAPLTSSNSAAAAAAAAMARCHSGSAGIVHLPYAAPSMLMCGRSHRCFGCLLHSVNRRVQSLAAAASRVRHPTVLQSGVPSSLQLGSLLRTPPIDAEGVSHPIAVMSHKQHQLIPASPQLRFGSTPSETSGVMQPRLEAFEIRNRRQTSFSGSRAESCSHWSAAVLSAPVRSVETANFGSHLTETLDHCRSRTAEVM